MVYDIVLTVLTCLNHMKIISLKPHGIPNAIDLQAAACLQENDAMSIPMWSPCLIYLSLRPRKNEDLRNPDASLSREEIEIKVRTELGSLPSGKLT